VRRIPVDLSREEHAVPRPPHPEEREGTAPTQNAALAWRASRGMGRPTDLGFTQDRHDRCASRQQPTCGVRDAARRVPNAGMVGDRFRVMRHSIKLGCVYINPRCPLSAQERRRSGRCARSQNVQVFGCRPHTGSATRAGGRHPKTCTIRTLPSSNARSMPDRFAPSIQSPWGAIEHSIASRSIVSDTIRLQCAGPFLLQNTTKNILRRSAVACRRLRQEFPAN
jgi:hypothetical protein